jgi:hypothetical protein
LGSKKYFSILTTSINPIYPGYQGYPGYQLFATLFIIVGVFQINFIACFTLIASLVCNKVESQINN